ncbi:MAG: hypothetical protein IKW54_00570 [Bacteroidales bacterium]|nr:hypothetical protein [Bacteroidales bacterium]
MLKSIVLFFRKRKIRRNLQNKRLMQFPDINKYPIISILVDENQKKDIKAMESFVKSSFNPKRLRFVVLSDVVPDNILQSDFMVFISKDDFDKLGRLKKEKEDALKAFSDDIFINLSDNDEDMMNDYIISYINSSFKIGHSKVNMKMHDLIMDYGIERSDVERLKILYKYILMLSGNKDEK